MLLYIKSDITLLYSCIYNRKRHLLLQVPFSGAEGETRTLAPVSRPTPLAGAPRHQLEYFCMVTYIIKFCCCRWRREWDSNPRYVAVRRFSRPFRYNHFGISPSALTSYHKLFLMSTLFIDILICL